MCFSVVGITVAHPSRPNAATCRLPRKTRNDNDATIFHAAISNQARHAAQINENGRHDVAQATDAATPDTNHPTAAQAFANPSQDS